MDHLPHQQNANTPLYKNMTKAIAHFSREKHAGEGSLASRRSRSIRSRLFPLATIVIALIATITTIPCVHTCNAFLIPLTRMHRAQSTYPVENTRKTNSPGQKSHCDVNLGIPTRKSSTLLRMAAKVSPENDEREWKAVVAAFKMYKAAYGDLKVPQRFVVPGMKPWPKAAWGMRLGKTVMHMRATGKYTNDHPQRKKILDELGFAWQVRPEPPKVTLGQVYTALETYNSIYGNTDVDYKFVVPNSADWPESVQELPLGKSLVSLSKQLDKQTNQKWKDRFAELGWPASVQSAPRPHPKAFVESIDADSEPKDSEVMESNPEVPEKKLSANEERFRKVYSALRTYHEIFGDLLVPQPFVVPDKDPQWPEDVWGLRLGARVNAIRSQGTFINANPERRKLLDDLGFVWSPPKAERRNRKNVIEAEDVSTRNSSQDSLETSSATADSNFDDLLSGSFGFKDFPMDGSEKEGSPKPAWAFEGGGDLQDLARPPPEENTEDEFLPPRTLQESLDEAVERAREVGIIEGLTESRRVIKGKQEKNIPWFNDDFGDEFVFEDVVEALTLYKSHYGDFSNLTEAEDFVIPSPVEQTGFLDDDDLATFDVDASSRAAQAIAKYTNSQDDFDESSPDNISEEIERLGKDLQQEVGVLTETGEDSQSVNYFKDVNWPDYLGGMKLGNIVARIRDGSLEVKHLPERKEQLDQIGFDWGEDRKFMDVPFEKAMCAMYAYYMVRGDLFVYEDFVMPDEDPWPQALAGYEIGKAVKRLRELQNFMEAYHPEKVSLLRMIDFIWFPTTALPLDPDEPDMDDELLRVSALGHPDYAKMIDIPMGLPDKIIADGPFFESDNPKNWWRVWHNWDYVKDYWYQKGRRDNAYVLRNMGYPKMADEHETKYGPGMFQQIEGTLSAIEAGLEGKSIEEKKDLLSKLSFYRQEMLGCTDVHPEQRDELLDKFDEHMRTIMKDSNIELVEEEDEQEYEEFEEDGLDDAVYEEEEEEEEDDEFEVEEVDIEDELGLNSR